MKTSINNTEIHAENQQSNTSKENCLQFLLSHLKITHLRYKNDKEEKK